MVFIHGMLTPWQVWTEQISAFRNDYDIYAVALNAHEEDCSSDFISVKQEAEDIVRLLKMLSIKKVDVLCGISLGGKIAYEIFNSGSITIDKLIMDGAPLVSCPKIAVWFMRMQYRQIIKKAQARNKKVISNFKKYFMPERFLDSFLKIADNMSLQSTDNIVRSAFHASSASKNNSHGKILYIHGTKINEILSVKSAAMLRKIYNNDHLCIVCFKGDSHCHKAIYEATIWIETVNKFLNSK